jgi:Mis12 protein
MKTFCELHQTVYSLYLFYFPFFGIVYNASDDIAFDALDGFEKTLKSTLLELEIAKRGRKNITVTLDDSVLNEISAGTDSLTETIIYQHQDVGSKFEIWALRNVLKIMDEHIPIVEPALGNAASKKPTRMYNEEDEKEIDSRLSQLEQAILLVSCFMDLFFLRDRIHFQALYLFLSHVGTKSSQGVGACAIIVCKAITRG